MASSKEELSLKSYRVANTPPSLFYIPDFISGDEEEALLSHVSSPSARWTTLTHRRLQAHPSPLTANNTLLGAPLPDWLTVPIIERLRSMPREPQGYALFENAPHGGPNHVLINEYKPGEGIMAHEDGAAYWPVVATVSLGASIVLDVHEKANQNALSEEDVKTYRVLQEPRSLLVTSEEMYTNHLHGISAAHVDKELGPETIANWHLLASSESLVAGVYERQTRVSLTYRDVLKVSNLGTRLNLIKR